ncbi:hypothetical protein D3C77_572930 [compost metagenome]
MGHTAGRDHGSIGNHASETRLLLAKQRVAHHRMNTVGADQQVCAMLAAIFEVQFDAAGILAHLLGTLAELHVL